MRKLLAIAIIAIVATLAGCTTGGPSAQVLITVTFPSGLDSNSAAAHSVSEVVSMAVRVTAPDIATPIDVKLNMNAANHTAAASFEIPPGVNRTFTVYAYNAASKAIYSGQAIADIPDGETTTIAISLTLTPANTGVSIVVPPGSTSLVYTTIPDLVTSDILVGRYTGPYQPSDFAVVTYIKVSGGWWIKPYFNNPLMGIDNNGSWSCDVVTGGYDDEATDYLSYLVRAGAAVPQAAGSSATPVPDEYFASVTATR